MLVTNNINTSSIMWLLFAAYYLLIFIENNKKWYERMKRCDALLWINKLLTIMNVLMKNHKNDVLLGINIFI